MKKRVFSLILALIFSIGLLPAAAFAEGGAAQLTTADNKEQVYGTFDEAWSAAIKSEGSTLKLLSDIELSKEVGEDGLPVSEGSFTLDHPRFEQQDPQGSHLESTARSERHSEYHHQKRQSGQHTDWARSDCNSDKFGRSENFRRNRCS